MAEYILLNINEEKLNPKAGETSIDMILPSPIKVRKDQIVGFLISPDSPNPESFSQVKWKIPEGKTGENMVAGGLIFSGDAPPKLISQMEGYLTTSEGKMKVGKMFEVFKNVDARTGNIKSDSSIIFHGDITGGVEVVSGGDVEVKGLIEESIIKAKGSIVAKGGITGGDTGQLIAGANIYSQFAQQANLEAVGNILVDGSILNCNILCGKKLTIRKRGLLVGGRIKASEGVDAGQVGSGGAVPTDIEIGGNPFKQAHIERIEKEKEKLSKELETCLAGLKHLEKELLGLVKLDPDDLTTSLFLAAEMAQRESDNLSDERVYQINKYGSGIMRYIRMSEELDVLQEEFEQVSKSSPGKTKAKLEVRKTAHPGVTVKIGAVSMKLLKEYDHVAFYFDSEKDEIVAGYL